jgi:transposase
VQFNVSKEQLECGDRIFQENEDEYQAKVEMQNKKCFGKAIVFVDSERDKKNMMPNLSERIVKSLENLLEMLKAIQNDN